VIKTRSRQNGRIGVLPAIVKSLLALPVRSLVFDDEGRHLRPRWQVRVRSHCQSAPPMRWLPPGPTSKGGRHAKRTSGLPIGSLRPPFRLKTPARACCRASSAGRMFAWETLRSRKHLLGVGSERPRLVAHFSDFRIVIFKAIFQ
jgi:hypothetical protein